MACRVDRKVDFVQYSEADELWQLMILHNKYSLELHGGKVAGFSWY